MVSHRAVPWDKSYKKLSNTSLNLKVKITNSWTCVLYFLAPTACDQRTLSPNFWPLLYWALYPFELLVLSGGTRCCLIHPLEHFKSRQCQSQELFHRTVALNSTEPHPETQSGCFSITSLYWQLKSSAQCYKTYFLSEISVSQFPTKFQTHWLS